MFDSADSAEQAFYDAFQHADMDAMRQVWDAEEDIVCVHPMGPSLQGLDAVHESWEAILSQGLQIQFTPHIINRFNDEHAAVHHLYEQISFGPGFQQTSIVVATNAYRLTDDGWRMVLHHGSPAQSSPVEDHPPPGLVH